MDDASLNVCLVGGAGYIGIELARFVSELDVVSNVTIVDNLQRGNFNVFCDESKWGSERVSFAEADVLDTRRLRSVLSNQSVIINLAATVPSKQAFTAPHVFEQINNWGVANIVDVVREVNPGAKLIHISSLGVFGSGVFDTVEVPMPTDPYGMSKLRGEGHVLIAREQLGLDCAVVRCPSVFGYSKNLRLDSLFNRMVFDANFSGKVVIPGDIEAYSPHCEIGNLIEFLAELVIGEMHDDVLFARCSNVSAQMLLDALYKFFPSLQSTYVDANQYRQQLVFSEDLPFVIPVEQDVLEAQLRRFLERFSF